MGIPLTNKRKGIAADPGSAKILVSGRNVDVDVDDEDEDEEEEEEDEEEEEEEDVHHDVGVHDDVEDDGNVQIQHLCLLQLFNAH